LDVSVNAGHDEFVLEACKKLYNLKAFTVDRIEQLQDLYGLAVKEYIAMAEAQGYACAICRMMTSNVRLFVDHCHLTGQVRGLLCNACNYGLGCFADRPESLQSAATYTAKYQAIIRNNPENGRFAPNFLPAKHLMMNGAQVENEKKGLFVRPEFVLIAPPKHKPLDVTEEVRAKLAALELVTV
jgi:hypothetical protein